MDFETYLEGLQGKTAAVIGIGVSNRPLIELLLRRHVAVTARDRGHDVVLLEKSGQLGGILNFSVHDPDKNDLALILSERECAAAAGCTMILGIPA